jgi:hypothetical protein
MSTEISKYAGFNVLKLRSAWNKVVTNLSSFVTFLVSRCDTKSKLHYLCVQELVLIVLHRWLRCGK